MRGSIKRSFTGLLVAGALVSSGVGADARGGSGGRGGSGIGGFTGIVGGYQGGGDLTGGARQLTRRRRLSRRRFPKPTPAILTRGFGTFGHGACSSVMTDPLCQN